ncbi:MAG: hypothetical protein ACK44O_03510 [Novosphingobium sp.]|jgi:hypothetical protein|uniref:hypothetical protein n=1 Tax=Novosphingobium sp. TaxID=1874826 RepID=UPI00391DFB5E|nr:hypothetical protein [Novosphingobium sp.]
MTLLRTILLKPWRLASALLLAVMLPATAHAAKWYVDNALGEVKPEEKVLPSTPKPVQLVYEFQRDGVAHPRATKETREYALNALKGTGAFTEVVETPLADGPVLRIKFNNVVKKEELDKAKKDGFRAGLGFGLFGGVVATDNYIVTLEYVAAPGATPIVTTVNHALHMKFGKKDVEIPGTEVKGVKLAVETVVRQALARGVNNIVADPAFLR